MRVVHVLRKPLSEGSIAANILKYGTGGMNVEGCRIVTSSSDAKLMERVNSPGGARNRVTTPPIGTFVRTNPPGSMDTKRGRWPANVVLEHLPGCQRAGSRKVRGCKGFPNGPGGKCDPQHGWGARPSAEVRPGPWVGHADPDGTETIDLWVCEPGCPVADMDACSLLGGMHSAGSARGGGLAISKAASMFFGDKHVDSNGSRYGDVGGASRFFKQIKDG